MVNDTVIELAVRKFKEDLKTGEHSYSVADALDVALEESGLSVNDFKFTDYQRLLGKVYDKC